MLSQTKKNIGYSIAYQLLAIILPLVTTPYITRVLQSENLGIYSFYHNIAAYFVLFAMLGFVNYGNRLIATSKNNPKDLDKAFSSLYYLQIIANGIVVIFYVLFSLFIAENKVSAFLEGLYVFSAFFDFTWLLNGLEKFKYTSLRSMVIKVVSAILIFVFVKGKSDIYLYTAICSLSILLTQLINIFALLKYKVHFTKVTKKDIFSHLPKVLIFFVPLLSISLYKYTNNIVLGTISTKTEVGYFSVAASLVLVPVCFVTALGNVMMPKISAAFSKGDLKSSNQFLEKSFFFAVAASSSMAFGIITVIREFVPLFYGEGYDKCSILIPILMMSTVFLSIADVIRTQYLIPRGQEKKYVFSIVFGAVINLCVVFPLVILFDSIGAAVASLLTEAAVCLFQIVVVRKEKNITKSIFLSLPFLLSGLIMYLSLSNKVFFNISVLNMLVKIAIGAIIYILLAGTYFLMLDSRKKETTTITND